jgi:OOP family OmpA-OmpF porin
MNSKFYLTLVALVSFSIIANAQIQTSEKKYYRANSITIKGGITSALTDIRTQDFKKTSSGSISEWKPGFGLSVNHMFSSVFGIQGNFTYNQLTGISDNDTTFNEDKNIYTKLGFPAPVYFETNVIHGSLSAYLNISNLAMGLNKANQKGNHARRLAFYTALGIGISNFDSKISDLPGDGLFEGVSYDKPFTDTSTGRTIGGYLKGKSGKATEFDIPFSLGVKYKLSKRIDLGLENTTHFLMTDKLDGFVYDRNSALKKNNDKFMLTSVTVTYKFAGKDENIDYIEWLDPTEVMYDDYQLLSDKIRKLSTDSDNDGVSDIFDKEPNTPKDAKVDGSGVAVDTDLDGIPDYKDADSFTPKGATVDESGKAVDADGDGVADVNDKEANTPKGSLVNQEGKTIKQDFATKDDLKNVVGYIAPTIYFDVNSSALKAVYYPELANLAKFMKQNMNAMITLSGNTDITGSESSNNKLGLKRADAVKDFLVKYYGIDPSRVETKSSGESNQVYQQNFSVNRRVDIEIKK